MTPLAPKACVVTSIPSPYQVELFNATAQFGQVKPQVVYLYRDWPSRSWTHELITHEHLFVDSSSLADMAKRWAADADLLVLADTTNRLSLEVMARRCAAGRPWCLWGERPGTRGFGFLGAIYRRWRLDALHRQQVPIWGIGGWAVAGYQREFGTKRSYFNVPYYSNLNRFHRPAMPAYEPVDGMRFLFSGALIRRKGVDLLATAFAQLADEFPMITLSLLGDGPLRERLQRQLRSWRDRVQFLGFKQWAELPKYYWQADVLCVPSRYDGWGLVVPEGLAAGLPVIATRQTGAALDLVRSHENGWLIEVNDGPALYDAMRECARLTSMDLIRLSEQAKQSVEGHSLGDGVRRWTRAAEATIGRELRDAHVSH